MSQLPKIAFEFCALHYLNLWLKSDRRLVTAMASGSRSEKLTAMSDFAAAYRIARSLPTKHEGNKERYESVLDIISGLGRRDFRGEKFIPAVVRTRDRISRQYGGRDVLSATTKFLWLKLKSPIIIYDSQARAALNVKKSGDFESYCSAWRKKFRSCKPEIENACRSLTGMGTYTYDPHFVIAEVASKEWFMERVFDTYLWHTGAE